MKGLRKIARAVMVALLLLAVIVPAGTYIILSTPWAQDRLREVAQTQLTALLGTDVSIGGVVYHPFNTLSVIGVRVNDDNGRPALEAARIAARFEVWTFLKTGRMDFDYAVIDAPQVSLYRNAPEDPLNIDGIIARLQPKEKDKEPSQFEVSVGTIVLRHGRFNYDILSTPDTVAGRLDPSHIHVSDLRMRAYVREGSNERWDVDLESLSLRESAGLELVDLEVSALVTPDVLNLRKFDIRLPDSRLTLKPIELRIDGYASLPATIARRSIVIEPVVPATIATADLEWLSPVFGHINRTLTTDFAIDAAMREVNVNRLTVIDDRGGLLELTGSVAGLDRPDSLQFNILRITFEAPSAEVASIAGMFNPRIASAIGRAGVLSLNGSGNGDMKGARIDFTAAEGPARVAFNGHVTTPDRYKTINFNGHASAAGIDLGRYTGNRSLGRLDLTLNGSGHISGYATEASGDVTVSRLDFNGYSYTGITASGRYDSREGTVSLGMISTDPNAQFTLELEAEPGRSYKSVNAHGDITALRPDALRLGGMNGHTLSGRFTLDAGGTRADDTDGTLTFESVVYADSTGHSLNINSLTADLDRSGSKDILTIESDFLNGTVQGRIIPSTLAHTLRHLAASVMPDVVATDNDADTADLNHFAADFTIANAELPGEFFRLPVQIIYPVDISASVDGPANTATLTLDAPYLQQGDKIIDQTMIAADIDGTERRATLLCTTRIPTKKGPMTAIIGVSGAENRLDTHIDWTIDRKIPLNGRFNFSTLMARSENGALCIDADFNPGQINFGDNVWEIGTSNIKWCDSRLSVDNFTLRSDDQLIAINGNASATAADTVSVELENISLVPIFETLEIDKALISGRATGRFTATEALSATPGLSTEGLHVDSIGYNYCTLGNADVKARWDNERKSFYLDADITNPEGQHSRITGDIFPADESLDLNFDAQHIRVGFMKPFMEAFTSAVSGYVSGRARLFGTFKDIDLTGDVLAEDLKLKIDFTNTWYTANDSIHIVPGLIELNDITIRDTDGHTARLNGWLRHDYFHSPVFEFDITDARDFLCYNVTKRLNPDWYGTIYGNGSAKVEGQPGVVSIGVDMTTTPHSTFTFVLSDRLDAEQYSFITFNDITDVSLKESLTMNDDIPAAVREYQARQAAMTADEPSTYLMDIKMDITDDAELIIVMDPVGGDSIRTFGAGDLTMEYNSADNFLGMRGTYTLDRGNYNFTLQNIIIKDFTIESGSSITFKGDPYSAELNLQAAYSLNANLSDLDESFTQDRELSHTNVPVQALLNVTGDMRQPDITFDLRFPTLTSDTYRKVRSIISTEDMMSRQIIYLLALNRFYTPDYMASTTKGNEIFSVAASTITSQISSMLGKLSDKWSIAPNLRSDRGDFSDVEVDVALSSRLLNNRLLLNGNFGYRDKSLNSNQFVGDFDIEYLLPPSGTWRLKAYNRYNDQSYYLRQATTTQGVGIMFKREFDLIFGRRHRNPAPADTVKTPCDSIR